MSGNYGLPGTPKTGFKFNMLKRLMQRQLKPEEWVLLGDQDLSDQAYKLLRPLTFRVSYRELRIRQLSTDRKASEISQSGIDRRWIVFHDLRKDSTIPDGIIEQMDPYGSSVLWITGGWEAKHVEMPGLAEGDVDESSQTNSIDAQKLDSPPTMNSTSDPLTVPVTRPETNQSTVSDTDLASLTPESLTSAPVQNASTTLQHESTVNKTNSTVQTSNLSTVTNPETNQSAVSDTDLASPTPESLTSAPVQNASTTLQHESTVNKTNSTVQTSNLSTVTNPETNQSAVSDTDLASPTPELLTSPPVQNASTIRKREIGVSMTLKRYLKKGASYARWYKGDDLLGIIESNVGSNRNRNSMYTYRPRSSTSSLQTTSKFSSESFTWGSASEVDSFDISEEDIVIAVMGPTGAGKSTFIKNATGYDLKIGDDLESCTSEIHVLKLGGTNVYIVDTPGFNDTNRSDLDIFKLISNWLEKRGTNRIYLSGLIYLHRISDNRMGGTTLKNYKIFEKLCGTDCFHKVTFGTTMWDDVESEEIGQERERQLYSDYFGEMIRKGARTARLKDDKSVAERVIKSILAEGSDLSPLSLQKELVSFQKDLPLTAAGKKMYQKLDEVFEGHQRALQQLSQDMRAEKSEKVRAILQREYETLTQELITLVADMQVLKLSLPFRLINYVLRK